MISIDFGNVIFTDETWVKANHGVSHVDRRYCDSTLILPVGIVVKENTLLPFTTAKVFQLTEEAVREVTPENLHATVEHTKKIMFEAWEKEGVTEQQVENFNIILREEEITSDNSDDDNPAQTEVEGDEDLGVVSLKW
ncbi:hypothetical protein ANN_13047 [Periplaneta americana]|uniref:Uncharacterized protein n=1 Tax=Periplaneta americana TaxID=6978 RepID=A0ABQ8TIA9_PERAM|nr:hypothetical protein ANN_13047 [Periplaneta americana]